MSSPSSADNRSVSEAGGPQPPSPPTASEFVWKAHAYINDYIRFADTKAGAVVAWCSGVAAGLLATRVHHLFARGRFLFWDWAWKETAFAVLAFAAFASLTLGLLAAFWAIHPRLWSSTTQPGFLFWERVRKHADADKFWNALKTQDPLKLTEEAGGHLFDLAGVAESKYYWVARGMWLALIGSLLGAVAVVVTG